MALALGGSVPLPPASFDIATLRTAIENAMTGSDADREARVAAAVLAVRAAVGDTPVLVPLSLSVNLAQVGTDITILIRNAVAGSTLTLSAVPAGLTLSSAQRAISGNPTQVGKYNLILTETLAGAINSPRQTGISIETTQASTGPTLGSLSLASSSVQVGSVVNIAIIGATTGSSLSAVANTLPAGVSVDSNSRRLTGTVTAAYSGSIQLVEMLAGATNSPNQTPVAFAATATAPTLGAVSLSGGLTNGSASSGTITGLTAGSSLASNVTGLTVNRSAGTYSFDGTGAAGTTANGLVETLAGATGSPRSSALTVAAGSVTPPSNQMTAGGESMTAGGEPMTAGAY